MVVPNIVEEPLLRMDLFGVVRASSLTGVDIWPRGRKAQAILAYLAATDEPEIPRRRLMGLLWSTRGQLQAQQSLRASLMELRQALDPLDARLLRIDNDKVVLDRSRVWLDGLSVHPGDQAAPLPTHAAAARFLESLAGLDPKYDAWIEASRVALAGPADAVVAVSRADPPAKFAADPAAGTEGAATRRLAVSVVPFEAIGHLGNDGYLPTALAQEMIGALARFRWFLVRPGSRVGDAAADYTVDGTVRRVPEGYRISVRLADPASHGAVLWADQVDVALANLDATIGHIAEQIVGRLDPQILAIETRRAARKPASSLSAYECVLRAIPLLYRFEHDEWRTAVNLLEQAMAIDPDYGRGFAFAALARFTGISQGWLPSENKMIESILAYASRAVECDPHDSLALAITAHNLVFTAHDFVQALNMFESALQYNPNCGYSWAYSSLTHAYLGRVAEARERLARARALLLYDPFGSFLDTFASVISFFSADWPATIELCRRQLIARPGFSNVRKIMIGALAHAGRYVEAHQQHMHLLAQEPDFAWSTYVRLYPFGIERDRQALATALRQARLLDAETTSADH